LSVRLPPFSSDATAGPAKTHGYTKIAKKGSIRVVALKSNVDPVYETATFEYVVFAPIVLRKFM